MTNLKCFLDKVLKSIIFTNIQSQVVDQEDKLQKAVSVRQNYQTQVSDLTCSINECEQRLQDASTLSVPVPEKLQQFQVRIPFSQQKSLFPWWKQTYYMK